MKGLIEKRTDLAIRAAEAAGKLLMDNFRLPVKVKVKSDGNLVSDADLKAEELIIKLFKKHYPQDAILSEESQSEPSKSEFRWIIDPLDGTHNYIKGIDIFGTSIALEFEGEVILGLIYMSATGELYLAKKGEGAWRNGKKLSVSNRVLKEVTLVYDSSIRYNKNDILANLDKLTDNVFNIRMFGSTVRSLSFLAEGKIDLEIEYSDKAWDFAAGLLLVEEAGGKATDLKGKSWNADIAGFIASNGIVHEDILKVIRG